MNFPSRSSSWMLCLAHPCSSRKETRPCQVSYRSQTLLGAGPPRLAGGTCPRLSLHPLTPRLPIAPRMTSPDGRPMGSRLTGRRCRRSLPKGSELGLERWPGSGARGRRRRHQRVGSRGGRSRSGGRSRGWSGGGACELPRVARAGTPRTLGGSSSGGLSRRRPPHRAPRPRQQGWGLPRRGTGSSQAKPSRPGSGSSSASGFLQTQAGGRRTVIISDSGIFSVGVVAAGSPLQLPAREGTAPSHRLALHLPLSSH